MGRSKFTSLVKFTKGVVKVPEKRELPTCSSRAIFPAIEVLGGVSVGFLGGRKRLYCEESGRSREVILRGMKEEESRGIRSLPWVIEGRPSRIELRELRREGEVLR